MTGTEKKEYVNFSKPSEHLITKEAYFHSHACSPHRHDTYVIGCTLFGVNGFNYRRSQHYSLPGDTIVIFPDELHDGAAKTAVGVQYRMAYIKPEILQQILGGAPLPFIRNGLSHDPRLFKASRVLLQRTDCPMESLEEEDALFELVQALICASGHNTKKRLIDYKAVEKVREYIHSMLYERVSLETLEIVAGRDRWALSRDFRAMYGTSPYRYLTMRRLEYVRQLIVSGKTLVDAAVLAGFTDQSHMTNHFTHSYGLSPARLLKLLKRP